MDKRCKKFIKKIRQLEEGDCLSYFDYEILCINHRTSFMLIHDMDMEEISYDDLLDFIRT